MNRLLALTLGLLFLALTAHAQVITTVAGGGPNNVPALSADLFPFGITVDSAGNKYIASGHIFKVDSAGLLTIVAGNGTRGFSGDGGPATAASFDDAHHVVVDGGGDLYIIDYFNYRIRKIDAATGIITTVAGNGTYGFSGDGGPATQARLSSVQGLAVDSSGNLYLADSSTRRIRKVDVATGIITTVAGTGGLGVGGDGGPATSAQFWSPFGVAVDASGNLYIADTGANRVRRVDHASGIITTVAGNGSSTFSGDGGPATAAGVSPSDVTVDASGNLYIPDGDASRIRRVDHTSGIIITVAGDGAFGFSGDGGPATSASLNFAFDVAVDNSGNLYIADTANGRIRQVDHSSGIITTIAGNGLGFSGDGWPATSAPVNGPRAVALDGSGDLFIIDSYRIRRVDHASGIINTVAGNGQEGYGGDGGPATDASIDKTNGLAADLNGNVYIGDRVNGRIRRVDHKSGIIATVAGNGTFGFSGDGGPATTASLGGAEGVAVDRSGDLYIADRGNNRVRRVNHKTGIITTVAGNGSAGFSGDGGPATSAALNSPGKVAVDDPGNLYIADSANYRIRRVDHKSGIITTMAGDGTPGFSGDGGPATSAMINDPSGVAVDGSGNLYMADALSNRIRRVDSRGVISTAAGNGIYGFSGDGGPATAASLALPVDVATDSIGNFYIADGANGRVRKVAIPVSSTECTGRKKHHHEGKHHAEHAHDKHNGEDGRDRRHGEDNHDQQCEEDHDEHHDDSERNLHHGEDDNDRHRDDGDHGRHHRVDQHPGGSMN